MLKIIFNSFFCAASGGLDYSQPDASSSGIGLHRFPAEGSVAGIARDCAWSVAALPLK